MRTLTVRQPWAWALIHGGKDVENRDWTPPRFTRELRILIHAGKAVDAAAAHPHPDLDMPDPGTLPRGVTYGLVTVTGWHESTSCAGGCSPWAEVDARYHWTVTDPAEVEPVPVRGSLTLWECPDNLIHPVR